MPPKASVLLKELRDSFPQDKAVIIVEGWATKLVPEVETCAVSVQQFQLPDDIASPPIGVLQMLDALHGYQTSAVIDLQFLRSTIAVRVPEIKDEDNLGVSVQLTVLKQLSELEKELIGDDKATLPTLSFKQQYLGSRASIEEKLNPSGKDAQPSKSPSLALQLRQVDLDAITMTRIALIKLSSSLRAVIALFTENSKKLINPRNTNDRMVS